MRIVDGDWGIVFYTTENSRNPVQEFLDSLDTKTNSRFIWSIRELCRRNVQAREPLVKHIEGKLWELRQESTGNIYRIMYIFFTGRKIILLHGFQKKSQQTPRREIEIASSRLKDFIERQGGEHGKT